MYHCIVTVTVVLVPIVLYDRLLNKVTVHIVLFDRLIL
jgi:hypothetical protein